MSLSFLFMIFFALRVSFPLGRLLSTVVVLCLPDLQHLIVWRMRMFQNLKTPGLLLSSWLTALFVSLVSLFFFPFIIKALCSLVHPNWSSNKSSGSVMTTLLRALVMVVQLYGSQDHVDPMWVFWWVQAQCYLCCTFFESQLIWTETICSGS